MKSIRTAAVVAVLAGVLGACSVGGNAPLVATPPASAGSSASGTAGSATATAAPPPGASGPEEAAVEAALRSYQMAIATGDFAMACSLNAPETSAQLMGAVLAGGGAAATCEEAFATVFAQPGAIGAAVEAQASTIVEDVTVSGLNATITWSSTRQGRSRTDGATLQIFDGQWRLVGAA